MRKTATWLCLAAIVGSGCHARFKKHAANLGAVQPDVVVQTGPHAFLGGGGSDLPGAVVGVVQAVRADQASQRLADAVQVDPVNHAFVAGLDDALRSGIPFEVSADPGAPLLQLEVVSWGLEAPAMGRPGALTYDFKVSIYDRDGRKVYKARQDCAVGFGDAAPVSVALGTVDNFKQLNQLTDDELQRTFESAARSCGAQLAVRMRQHASPTGPSTDGIAATE